ncbi:MAG: DNA-3-methyladenine glycosylase [Candidatus Methylacidiphilales bacterium]|nr:DNA-3-methyladenine glycosylase [Candidatus Methylacidiphilales bacterium]
MKAGKSRRLSRLFYQGDDVVAIARTLLGKRLCTHIGGVVTSGRIVETEAYGGITDRASHAFGGRRTTRTETMYAAGGLAYVYLCYGLHHLFNVVTGPEGRPDAVLVRAVEPLEGVEVMLRRRRMESAARRLTAGPGVMSQALGITTAIDRCDLRGDRVWIVDDGVSVAGADVVCSPRVGVDYAGEDARRPWRFRIRGHRFTSPAR